MSTAFAGRRNRALFTVIAGIGAASLLLSACSSGDTPAAGGGEDTATALTLLTPAENSIVRDELAVLAGDQCATEDEALPLESETVAQADVNQKITLLASQDALPVMFVAGTAQVKPDGDLGKNDLALDYEATLKELGVWDNILPAAVSTVKAAYGGNMASLPFQYNLEGIWYNKAIFAENDVEVPETYDELLDAFATFKEAGVTPITEPGSQGWPITRLIGNYIFRSVGPDAMKDIQSGDAKLTDPEYVEAAQAIADLGTEGYFGEGITSRDTDTAYAQFLNGDAATMYMGSWLLANLNDEEQNVIGEDNVGFMPFPNVDGGAGDSGQWPANAGAATAVSTKAYGPKVGDWLSCIAENYGSSVLANQGVVSGFKVNEEVTDVKPLTAEIQTIVSEASETVLWFEALFDAKTTSDAQTNVSLLITGQMSAEDYMSQLQSDLEQAQ
ncbi:extracellular solute-binding protein [Conyzicola lurida]|uniref:extracellular solute-binding protein n=1 Tax=Conyzicola lurida TaxID=1172621 RepID=UPI00161811F4